MTDANVFQLLGLIYLAVGLGMLLNSGFYNRMINQLVQSPPMIYFSGFSALTVGYLLARYYSFWGADRRVILTIIGWIALVKGLTLLILPQQFVKLTAFMVRSEKSTVWQGAVAVLIGAAMMYLGFFAA